MSAVAWQLGHSLVTGSILLLGAGRWQIAPPLLLLWALPAFLALRYAAYPSRAAGATGSLLANALTASRLLLVLGVLVWHWAAAGAAEPAWLVILLLLLAEVTDYLDGRAARRALRAAGSAALPGSGGDASFGATFDMEVDAYVTGALALQAVLYHDAPLWLLAAGLWRYAYAVWEAGLTRRWRRAGRILPCDVTLPGWFRWQAKTICVLSVMLLIALSLPGLDPGLITALSAAVVTLLSYSFVTSVPLLLRADVDIAGSAPIRS